MVTAASHLRSVSREGARVARDREDLAAIAAYRRDPTPRRRAELVNRFMALTLRIARRYHRGEEPLEDLEQVACIGLLKAIDGFDPERGGSFGAYAAPTITGELRRHFRDKGWTVRVPRDLQELSLRILRTQDAMTAQLGRAPTAAELAERLATTVDRVLEAREIGSAMRPVSLDRPMGAQDPEAGALVEQLGAPDDGYDGVERTMVGDALLSGLPERERAIVVLRFREGLTQQAIGDRLGISQMHVSRLLRRALGELAAGAEPSSTVSPLAVA